MYLARYLLMLGFVVATGSWVGVTVFTICYWFYMVNRVRREEPVLIEIFGDSYADYCRDVNRFLPGTGRLDRNFWFFDWEIMLSNNGHWNFVAIVAGYAYILAMLRWVVNWPLS